MGITEYSTKKLWKFPLNLTGSADIQESFRLCELLCSIISDGKIYTCGVIPSIKHFNKYFQKDLQVCDKDYIDIYKIKNLDEIFDFLRKPVPFCRYCNTNKPVYNIDWAISKKEISEWV